MKINCDCCGRLFDRKPSHVKEKNYCSKECWRQSDKTRPNRKTGETRACKSCGKSFYVPQSSIKKGRGVYCSKTCKTEALKTYQICPICNETFYNKGNSSRRKYCSKKCSGLARKKKIVVNCTTCNAPISRHPSSLKTKNFCSKECHDMYQSRNKISYTCKTCGEVFKLNKSLTKQEGRNPTYCSISCRDKDPEWDGSIKGNLAQSKKKGLNKLEKKGNIILDSLNIDYSTQELIEKKFLVDVYIPEKKLVIQWDGDYWHGYEKKIEEVEPRIKKRMQLDISQDAYMRKCGYSILRFWEHEVYKEKEYVSDTIRKAVQETT